jgi:hypothetical protein
MFCGEQIGNALAELTRLGAQLIVGERLDGGFQRIDLFHRGKHALDRSFVTGAKNFCE